MTQATNRKSAPQQTDQQSVVAICESLGQVKDAIRRLERNEFPKNQISLVAKSLEDDSELHGYVQFGDPSETDAGRGALVGGMFGALAGAAFLFIPGFGPLVVLGPLAGGMTGFVVGALVGAMLGWGIPEDQVSDYEQKVKEGKYLVIAHGNPLEVDTAYSTLREGDYEEVNLHASSSEDSPEIDDSPV